MLLTRAPLYSGLQAIPFSFDLHVLSTPPAFILSQDQTLRVLKKRKNLNPYYILLKEYNRALLYIRLLYVCHYLVFKDLF